MWCGPLGGSSRPQQIRGPADTEAAGEARGEAVGGCGMMALLTETEGPFRRVRGPADTTAVREAGGEGVTQDSGSYDL